MKIFVNHLGYRPGDTAKRAIIQGEGRFEEFLVIDLNAMGYNEIGPNSRKNEVAWKGRLERVVTDMGTYSVADFSDLRKPGIYLVSLGNEFNSVPFQIREDVYSRTLRKAFGYIHIQRCGQAVEDYHEACHLDDAIRRDNGEYVNTTGGWHDAGDLRKWMAHTMLLAVGICQLKRNKNPEWRSFDPREGDLLNELRWGNAFFQKMMDEKGQIWNDVAAGVDGDNSDNRWTDNIPGTSDDRHVNTSFNPEIQWEFIYLQAMLARVFSSTDREYSARCLASARKALAFMDTHPNSEAKMFAWAVMAMKELFAGTGERIYLNRLKLQLNELLALQEKEFRFGQEAVKGFFYRNECKKELFTDLRDSGILLIALCEAMEVLRDGNSLKTECLDAIKMYCWNCILPVSSTNPYGIIPFGMYENEPTSEKYRVLEGALKYRFFAPVNGNASDGVAYLGLTSHLLSHGVGIQMAGLLLKDERLLETARAQMEWVMGRNPFNSCLMTGEGINNPYPHSRFLGLIPGGVMNGIIGSEDDEPFLDLSCGMDWRTTEYWSPHTCFYIWYMSLV